MYVHGAGVANVFIAPDIVEQLLPGEYLVRMGSQKIEKFQLLRGHFDVPAHVGNGIVCEVDAQVRIVHAVPGRVRSGGGCLLALVIAAQHSLDSGDQLL